MTQANDGSPSSPDGITGKLSSWISTTELSDVPSDIQTRAKYLLLDGLACGMVGSHLDWSEIAANAIFAFESRGDCVVIGWGLNHRLSPLAAAILNSTFIQGFELDDYHSTAPLHSNSLLIPALLAASTTQAVPQKVTGKDFLRSYIIGCEVGPRIGLALHGADLLSRGWHSGAVQGPSAVAAAVSSLLKLPPSKVEDALGIAATQSAGLMSAQFGSMAKRMQHGFASRNGLFATLLAYGGYTGINQVYEVPYGGFLSCFSQGANFEPKSLPDEITKGMGEVWEIENIRVKLYASMAALHGTIDAAERLQKRYPEKFGNLDQIRSIETRHSRAAYEHGGWKTEKGKTMSSVAAQMSIQYAAAAQFVDGAVLAKQFSRQRLNRPEVLALMQKVTPVHDETFDLDSRKDGWRTVMTVTFEDGSTVEENVKAPTGIDPPASNADIVHKWRGLVNDLLDQDRMEAIENCVLNIDQRDDAIETLSNLLEGVVKNPIA